MISYLQLVGPTVAIPIRAVSTEAELAWRPIDVALREPDARFLIAPAALASHLRVSRNEAGYWPSVVKTPALIYSRGHLDGKTMRQTSLSANWSYLDDANQVVDMPADFVRWGKKVIQWVRRVAPNWHKYKHHRITDKAEAARRAGMEMIF